MHAEEAVLFLVVTVLSFALVATIVAPLIRKKRVGRRLARRPGRSTRCRPWCPARDRRPAVPDVAGAGCCRGFCFCPFDGTPLGPTTAHQPGAWFLGADVRAPAGIPRKICPRCARAYRQDTEVSVCAHDGIPLVPVN